MEAVVQAWLVEQCQLIPGTTRGLVLLGRAEGGTPGPVAHWPKGAGGTAELTFAAQSAASRRSVVTAEQRSAENSPAKHSLVAVPFSLSRGFAGAVAIEVDASGEIEAEELVERLRSGTVWLEQLTRADATQRCLATVLELIGTSVAHEQYRGAASAVATELAMRLRCERVSIGFARRGQIRVETLSHSADFDGKSRMIRDLGLAMDEASDQDASVIYPPLSGSTPRITIAHQELTRQHGTGAACSVPIASDGRIVGAVTLERPSGSRFDAETLKICEQLVSLVGPILELKRRNDTQLLERGREFMRAQIAKLFGAGYPALKLVSASCVAVLLGLSLIKGSYRVSAVATLEGRVQRVIVAGFDGYISEANARAGDLVRRGQILGRLDARDLVLEQRKGSARKEQIRKEYREALAEHNRTQASILSAKLAQAEAELQLVGEHLTRTRLVAPFDGIIVKGDLSQSLGSPVERGEVLFQVAPLDGYRVILKVDERDISNVGPGQPGELALSAIPGEPLALVVERVTPVATSDDGRNYFRVEAQLQQGADSLRPGMEGIAKIEVDRRRLIWIWTHDLFDWLRLWAWSWWP